MKISHILKATLLSFLFPVLLNCSSTEPSINSSSNQEREEEEASTKPERVGGTNTGSTDLETIGEIHNGPKVSSNIGLKIERAASALIPTVSDLPDKGGGGSLSLPMSVSKYSPLPLTGDWSRFLKEENRSVLVNIFGDKQGEEASGTEIRHILRLLRNELASTLEQDSEITCFGSWSKTLTEGDSIELPFFEPISNGSEKNHRFDCYTDQILPDESSKYVTLYGVDEEGIIRLAKMSDLTETGLGKSQGDSSHSYSILLASFAEVQEGGNIRLFLDIQYALAVNYIGADNRFQTFDDEFFKVRSRITGEVLLDDNDNPVLGAGDSQVTKYDRGTGGFMPAGEEWVGATKAIGRGSYGADQVSLLAIDSSWSSLVGAGGTFCIVMPDDGSGVPQETEFSDCGALEMAFAWRGGFLFPALPASDEIFADKSFFNWETDLISNSGDNFTIPDYSFVTEEEEEWEE